MKKPDESGNYKTLKPGILNRLMKIAVIKESEL